MNAQQESLRTENDGAHLPLPPYRYRESSGGIFTFLGSPRVVIWGRFPIAPTGGFIEFWELEREDDGCHAIKDIVVDNLCRLEAGRFHWSMPKRFGKVGIHSSAHSTSLTVPGFPDAISIELNENADLTPVARGSMELHLANGDFASLKFSDLSKAVTASFLCTTQKLDGYHQYFQGDVELTAPRPQIDSVK
ncbi:hypothetical protein [Neorhodopirellula lusitana]|uniref:hypothetical protein n=1 Tax=Neorhodopirellula lusitana TaxID=445327 RepID=UPI00384BEA71